MLSVVLLLAACGADRPAQKWKDRLDEADRTQQADDLEAAERRYEELLDAAPDDHERRAVLNELAAIHEKRGDYDRALARYEEVWRDDDIDDEHGGRALYRSALIRLEERDQTDRGLALLERTATRYPASVSAEFAIRRLADHYTDRHDFEALEDQLTDLYEEVSGEAVADNILFEVAVRLHEEAGDAGAALPYYRRVHTDHDEMFGLADDALWEEARIHQRRQHWPEAIALYEELADRLDASWFIGSYDSPLADDARFELGRIHLIFLDNYESAIAHFEQYLKDFPDHLKADDAAWHIVHAHRLAGHREAFSEKLDEFERDFPESRYTRRVDGLREREASR